MLQTLALAAALSMAPAQNGALALTNERCTFGGEFGPTRPSAQYLPGDIFFLAFDIENLSPTPEGAFKYTMTMQVTDAAGHAVSSPKPDEVDANLPLGGNKAPAYAFYDIRPDLPAGAYTCRVTVTDRVTNTTKSLAKSFEVLPPAFGTVGLTVSYDPETKSSAPFMGMAGQVLWLHFGVIGMGRDAQTKQPNVVAELRVFENGKPTKEKPVVVALDPKVKIDENDLGVVFRMPVPLNREGKFTLELKTECKITNKTYKMSFPVTVTASPK